MPFAHIKRVSSISKHSWGAKCDEYQYDAYDNLYHNKNKSYKFINQISLGTPPHITQIQVSFVHKHLEFKVQI
jgi:hypothetical protein